MFILIHGAYHGGWCWDRLVARLQDRGQTCFAPDLPGHGTDPGWLVDQSMENYVSRIAHAIDEADTPVSLVGHSMSGTTALLAAVARPERIERIVFLTAYIPAPGESILHCLGKDPACFAETSRTEVEGINAVSVKTHSLGRDFYQDADERELKWVQDRLQLQAPRPFRHVCDYDPAIIADIPKAAIICQRDRAISAGYQRDMAERAGCDPIRDIDSDHSPFVTHPDELAALLMEIA